MRLALLAVCVLAPAGCDRLNYFVQEDWAVRNFHAHEDEFIALGHALDANPNILGAANCDSNECWRIGRNFPFSWRDAEWPDNEKFVPHLESIGLTGYIFFQRGDDGRVWLPDYDGGRTGDFSLTISYVYWPNPDETFTSCQNYVPPTEDFYFCHVELGHGWLLEKSGLNDAKLDSCVTRLVECQIDTDGTTASCTPDECSELISDY